MVSLNVVGFGRNVEVQRLNYWQLLCIYVQLTKHFLGNFVQPLFNAFVLIQTVQSMLAMFNYATKIHQCNKSDTYVSSRSLKVMVQLGKPHLWLTDVTLWSDSWLAHGGWKLVLFCLDRPVSGWGFNPLYPTGAVQQRNLCKPFLGLKPVTFFLSVFQFHTKALGPFWSRGMALHHTFSKCYISH